MSKRKHWRLDVDQAVYERAHRDAARMDVDMPEFLRIALNTCEYVRRRDVLENCGGVRGAGKEHTDWMERALEGDESAEPMLVHHKPKAPRKTEKP